MLASGRVQSWLLLGISFVVLPLLVAALISFVVPEVMKQFYSNDLYIQKALKQQVMSDHAWIEQQQLQFAWQQPEHLTTMFCRDHQGLWLGQDQTERCYQQYGYFPKYVGELHPYPLHTLATSHEEKATIVHRSVVMLSSKALPQLQTKQSGKWPCYSTSTILSGFLTCGLLTQRPTAQFEQ